jgi:hypothetical protein
MVQIHSLSQQSDSLQGVKGSKYGARVAIDCLIWLGCWANIFLCQTSLEEIF